MDKTNASISDGNGNLILFTGGVALYNSQGDIIQNGDSINYGYTWETWISLPGAYGAINGALFIPSISNENYYNLFHLRGDSIQGGGGSGSSFGDGLFYSSINVNDSVEKKMWLLFWIPYRIQVWLPVEMEMEEIGG